MLASVVSAERQVETRSNDDVDDCCCAAAVAPLADCVTPALITAYVVQHRVVRAAVR
jgi:hypothetical protein